jgi:hypothetical protein
MCVILDVSLFALGLNAQGTQEGQNFFDGWDFFTGSDPTHGIVQFVDQANGVRISLPLHCFMKVILFEWQTSSGLVQVNNEGNAVMRVETTPQVSGNRQSVRITTQSSMEGGLVLMDSVHMPTGCGVWPAWWSDGN